MRPSHRSWFAPLLLLPLLLSLNACGSGWRELTREEKAKGSIVFLYIDTEDMKGHLDRVVLRQAKAGAEPVYWGLDIKDESYVWFEGLPNGKYMLDNYGGMDGVNILWMRWWSSTNYVYNFPQQGSGFSIEKPGVYFLGAYKHKHIRVPGIFKADKFDMVPVKTPSEKEIFPVILKQLEKADSPLLPMAQRYGKKL
jgi:hypothetical protein